MAIILEKAQASLRRGRKESNRKNCHAIVHEEGGVLLQSS